MHEFKVLFIGLAIVEDVSATRWFWALGMCPKVLEMKYKFWDVRSKV
jgi:hypothetical protein